MVDWLNRKPDNWFQAGECGKNRWISEKERKLKELESEDNRYGIGSTSME